MIYLFSNKKLRGYQDAIAGIKVRRNKRIAHYDLEYQLTKKVTPLSGPSREEIELALKALREFMNTIQMSFCGSKTAYEHLSMIDDGNALIVTLEKGLRYQELVKAGIIPRDDFRQNRKS